MHGDVGLVEIDGMVARDPPAHYACRRNHLLGFEELLYLLQVTDSSRPRTLPMYYALALYEDDGATLDNLREALTTLEEMVRTARRVFGGAHPLTEQIEEVLRAARAALHARETPSPPPGQT